MKIKKKLNLPIDKFISLSLYHKKFGYGKILKLDLDKALVDFENFSSKKIYLKYLKFID